MSHLSACRDLHSDVHRKVDPVHAQNENHVHPCENLMLRLMSNGCAARAVQHTLRTTRIAALDIIDCVEAPAVAHLELLRSARLHWPPRPRPGLYSDPRGARPVSGHPVWRVAVLCSCRCGGTAAARPRAVCAVMLGHLLDVVIGAVAQVDRSVILRRSIDISVPSLCVARQRSGIVQCRESEHQPEGGDDRGFPSVLPSPKRAKRVMHFWLIKQADSNCQSIQDQLRCVTMNGSVLTWLALFRLRVRVLGPDPLAARFSAAEPLLRLSPRECPRAAATALPISLAFWTTALATAPAPVLMLAMRRVGPKLLVSLLLMPPPLPPAPERSPRFRCRGWSDRNPPRGSRNRSQWGGVLSRPASRASRARRFDGGADAACIPKSTVNMLINRMLPL